MQEPTSSEFLEIDEIPLHIDAWHIENLWVLWQGPDTRGESEIMPGTVGVRPVIRRPTKSRRDLEMFITGLFDFNGDRPLDVRSQLQTNIDFLRTQIADPKMTGDGTRAAILHMPNGPRVADVTVEAFTFGPRGPTSVKAVLTLELPTGAFTDTEGS